MHKKTVFRAILAFLISYVVFLVLWIQVKDVYGKGITLAVSNIIPVIKPVSFEELTEQDQILQATFVPTQYRSHLLIDIPVKTSSYTFNVPLTLAIMAALYFFLKRRRMAYAQALLILLAVHFLYVFTLEAKELTDVLIDGGIEPYSKPKLFIYQFLWSFTENMVIRFEPFLIGFYMYIRFRK